MHGRAVRKLKGNFEILEAKINSKKNKQTNTEIAIPVAQSLGFWATHEAHLEENKAE